MDNYNKVNEEIQSFLTNKKTEDNEKNINTPNKVDEHNQWNKDNNLEILLERLYNLYSEINTHLKYDNEKGLKNSLLANDIKLNLVNESLLGTLKNVVSDKNRLLEENNNLTKEKNEFEQKYNKSKFYSQKLEGGLEYKSSNVSELNRIIQDQKQKLGELNNHLDKIRIELKQKENLEEEYNLKFQRQSEKYSFYDKEMETLTNLANEREASLKKLLNEKREEETKNSGIKIKLSENERIIEQLNQKLDIKDKNLVMCNNELSKLLVENKKMRIENEKYKSTSNYYEGINKNLNQQNSYLNKQLNKIIQSEKYIKEGLDVIDVFEGKKKKYKRKLRKAKYAVKKLTDENEELKNKIEDNAYKVNANDDTLQLHDKIETLARANKEYKEKINLLENEKKINLLNQKETVSLKNNLKENNKYTDKSYKSSILEEKIRKAKEKLNLPFSNKNIYDMEQLRLKLKTKDYQPSKEIKGFNTNNNRIDKYKFDVDNRTDKYNFDNGNNDNNHIYNKYVKYNDKEDKKEGKYYSLYKESPLYEPINLENNYEEKETEPKRRNRFMGGLDEESILEEKSLGYDQDAEAAELKAFLDSHKNNRLQKSDKNKLVDKIALLDGYSHNYDDKKEMNNKKYFDAPSTESLKSFQTSSTLKEMMERTNKLQEKFEKLDNDLNKVKKNKSSKNMDNTLSMQYKDINVDSESDIL